VRSSEPHGEVQPRVTGATVERETMRVTFLHKGLARESRTCVEAHRVYYDQLASVLSSDSSAEGATAS
jgi:hypothetical protein